MDFLSIAFQEKWPTAVRARLIKVWQYTGHRCLGIPERKRKEQGSDRAAKRNPRMRVVALAQINNSTVQVITSAPIKSIAAIQNRKLLTPNYSYRISQSRNSHDYWHQTRPLRIFQRQLRKIPQDCILSTIMNPLFTIHVTLLTTKSATGFTEKAWKQVHSDQTRFSICLDYTTDFMNQGIQAVNGRLGRVRPRWSRAVQPF